MAKKATLKQYAKDLVEKNIEELDEAIEDLNKRLKRYDAIKEQRDKLLAARRALLGGNRQTGEGGSKLRQEDLVRFLKQNPEGVTPSQAAEEFGVKQPTVSSHFYRGRHERFLQRASDGLWFLRDPKNGINTEEDL